MEEVTVIEEDRIGLLADITGVLGKNNVNIESVYVADTNEGKAIIRLVVREGTAAKKLLEANGFRVFDSDVFIVKIPNVPGELARLSRLLVDNDISINYIYVVDRAGEIVNAISTSDNERAKCVLKEFL